MSTASLVTAARSKIGPLLHQHLSAIEDEWGGLEFSNGDYKSIFGFVPILDEIFANQLPAPYKAEYKQMQLDVWGRSLGETARPLGSDFSVFIYPLFVQGERFTTSVFYHR